MKKEIVISFVIGGLIFALLGFQVLFGYLMFSKISNLETFASNVASLINQGQQKQTVQTPAADVKK